MLQDSEKTLKPLVVAVSGVVIVESAGFVAILLVLFKRTSALELCLLHPAVLRLVFHFIEVHH